MMHIQKAFIISPTQTQNKHQPVTIASHRVRLRDTGVGEKLPINLRAFLLLGKRQQSRKDIEFLAVV